MRKKRFDPSYLEPKDGDFAGFVEKLNQKSVAELKALQVNDELMREQVNDELMREQVNEELNGAASGVWSAPIPDVKASDIKASSPMHRDTVISQPEDAFKVEVPSGATNRPAPNRSASSSLSTGGSVFLIFIGFALFFYGGMSGNEDFVMSGFFFVFLSIVFNIIRQKRQRRR